MFADGRRQAGASPETLAIFERRLRVPPDNDEVAAIRAMNVPVPDPSGWRLPDRPLPESYLSLLRYSDGGECGGGERWFQLFRTSGPVGVREMTLSYHVPVYMPGALPFAFNGSGIFYLFDMRGRADEYPVIAASAGALGWEPDEYALVAPTLAEACRGTTNIGDLLYG